MQLSDIRKEINFRELGGYESADGRKVKHGIFYRCGAPGDLNEEELEYVRSLGIRHIFDFRSLYEALECPDPEIGAQYHNINAIVDEKGNEVVFDPEGIEKGANEHEQAQIFLRKMYGGLPFAKAYQEMMKVIQREETPILFHCSAGKDRTGIAAVIILLLLGVNEETALADYMLTNEYRKVLIERFFEKMDPILAQDEEMKEQLIAFEGVRQDSAEASLASIQKRCGSIENYFETVYGIDAAERERLKDLYLD